MALTLLDACDNVGRAGNGPTIIDLSFINDPSPAVDANSTDPISPTTNLISSDHASTRLTDNTLNRTPISLASTPTRSNDDAPSHALISPHNASSSSNVVLTWINEDVSVESTPVKLSSSIQESSHPDGSPAAIQNRLLSTPQASSCLRTV